MKLIATIAASAALFTASATSSFAGGFNEPINDTPTVTIETPPPATGTSQGIGSGGVAGILIPVLVIAGVAAAIAAND